MVCIVGECNSDRHLEGIKLIKTEKNAHIDCDEAAVIVGKDGTVNVRCALGVIVDGERFSGSLPRGVQLITCGVSPKNTVCVTSRTDEKITLSLNRTIRTQKGGLCEPLEQPVNIVNIISADDEFDIMAAFAARLLLGI